jgi:predicted TPR repeat methyltransferase
MESNTTREYRGEEAAQYENQATEIAWHGHEILFGLMYEFVTPDEALLDIGIGSGLSSCLFQKAGLHVSGFDNSAEMLAGCASKHFSGKISQHDVRDVPFPYETGSFHHIISLAVLNFFADLEPVINEASRILKPKGIFGFTVEENMPEQESQYTIRVNNEVDQDTESFEVAMYRHSDGAIRTFLENVGFVVLKKFTFLANRYPEQGIEVYLTIYVAQKEHT